VPQTCARLPTTGHYFGLAYKEPNLFKSELDVIFGMTRPCNSHHSHGPRDHTPRRPSSLKPGIPDCWVGRLCVHGASPQILCYCHLAGMESSEGPTLLTQAEHTTRGSPPARHRVLHIPRARGSGLVCLRVSSAFASCPFLSASDISLPLRPLQSTTTTTPL